MNGFVELVSMSAIEELKMKALALPLEQRVVLAESLLGSLPHGGEEMSEAEELAEVERREAEIQNGQVKPLSDGEFWRAVKAARQQ